MPAGPDWIHEIKHDGYRLTVHREGNRVRLFTRNGHDWTDRYPLIVEAAHRIRIGSFVSDGEAVLLGVDGRSDFDGLHSRQHNDEVQFYAFDVLMSDGDDLRKLPLSMRKASLARLLARRINGIFLSDFERGEIGPDLFRHGVIARQSIDSDQGKNSVFSALCYFKNTLLASTSDASSEIARISN